MICKKKLASQQIVLDEYLSPCITFEVIIAYSDKRRNQTGGMHSYLYHRSEDGFHTAVYPTAIYKFKSTLNVMNALYFAKVPFHLGVFYLFQ